MIKPILTTFFAAMLPLVELRLALPVGYIKLGLSLPVATIVSILGNLVAIGFALWLCPYVIKFIEKNSPWFHKILEKIFHRTRTKHSQKVVALGEVFLITFIAIPLPGSGGWTGVLIAFLFGMRYWVAFRFISIGIILSGIIVASLTYFGVEMATSIKDNAASRHLMEISNLVLPETATEQETE
jgi:uncharacterized membrane protein